MAVAAGRDPAAEHRRLDEEPVLARAGGAGRRRGAPVGHVQPELPGVLAFLTIFEAVLRQGCGRRAGLCCAEGEVCRNPARASVGRRAVAEWGMWRVSPNDTAAVAGDATFARHERIAADEAGCRVLAGLPRDADDD